MKLNNKIILLGIFLPAIGIIVGKYFLNQDEIIKRSLMKGSAISTLVIFCLFSVWFFVFIGSL